MQVDSAVLAGLMAGRASVDQYMTTRQTQEHPWNEETATELLCTAASPPITYAQFTRPQEAVVGADWIWWWIDQAGEAFGMLVQAKKLHRAPGGGRWWADFGYRRGDRNQITALLTSADYLNVPASYMVYGGDTAYRDGLCCGPKHVTMECVRCERLSVSITAALVIDNLAISSPAYGTRIDTLWWASPLEDLADPSVLSDSIWDLHLRNVGPELRDFLNFPQSGARHAARVIFETVSRVRSAQFSLAVADNAAVNAGPVFQNLPRDRGHFRQPYWPFVLRGLRTQAPQYVYDIAAGRDAPQWLVEHAAGLVIVRL
jgi:hypothetical protein